MSAIEAIVLGGPGPVRVLHLLPPVNVLRLTGRRAPLARAHVRSVPEVSFKKVDATEMAVPRGGAAHPT